MELAIDLIENNILISSVKRQNLALLRCCESNVDKAPNILYYFFNYSLTGNINFKDTASITIICFYLKVIRFIHVI